MTFVQCHAVVTLEALVTSQCEKLLNCYIKQKHIEAKPDYQKETIDNCLRKSPYLRCRETKLQRAKSVLTNNLNSSGVPITAKKLSSLMSRHLTTYHKLQLCSAGFWSRKLN